MNQEHHPVFRSFVPFSGETPAGYTVDFLGCLARHQFWHAAADLPAHIVTTTFPPVDEDYFLWVHLLESILGAKDRYTMVELGAGYGEWVVRAFHALRQRHENLLPFCAVAVEADPVHFEWARLNLADNGLLPSQYKLIQAAVTGKPGDLFFVIGSPEGNDAPNQWYGQAVSWADDVAGDGGDYSGFKAVRHANGWKSIKVPGVSLTDVIKDLDLIDFIHMDIQGQELSAVLSGLGELCRTTKRLHVDTHSHEIDQGLYDLLTHNGWECVRRYGWKSNAITPYGTIQFQDGIQAWTNPRLR